MCRCKEIKESVSELSLKYGHLEVVDGPDFSSYGCECCGQTGCNVQLVTLWKYGGDGILYYMCDDCIFAFNYGYIDCTECDVEWGEK